MNEINEIAVCCTSVQFLLCDAMLARYMLSLCVRPSVRLSFTSWHCTKWLNIGSCKWRQMIAPIP